MTAVTAYQRASALLDVGRDAQAVETLRAALAGTPDDAALLTLLCFALRRRGDLPGALATVEAALAAEPGRPETHVEHAETLLALLRDDAARAAAEQAVRLAPDRPSGHLVLARALAADRRFAEARAAAARGLALAPRSVEALLTVADVARDAGRRDEAEEAARAALRIDPDNDYGRWLLAMLDAERLRVRRSLRTLRDVARDNPGRPNVLSMTWPIRRLLSGLRRWLTVAVVLTCAAALIAVRFPPMLPPSRLMAAVFVLFAAGFSVRLLLPAGALPWRSLRLAPSLLRRSLHARMVVAVVQSGLLIGYAVTATTLLTVIAVVLVPVQLILGLTAAIGAHLDDPGHLHALRDIARRLRELRAELRRWWADTRRDLRDAWHDDP
ncbi:tetratricopeptide repeat protein [Actinoplanes flavus]|uniref:Tetratricopeptide repeat protein n=1 Tax=Actinoplanes flavus TaxID=2820290 RepID=A0ABS3UEX6_9ACTN|nr:tetratricopeptide repeat protein [Actinoplanes flavus]MBO3737332.1 tetratricopeptide repeat protein [Actinoplanes flavus]